MIMAEETMSISEVVKSVETKKDITIDDWTVAVLAPDGRKIDTDPEQTLSNFKEIDKLVVQGAVVSSGPPSNRRSSILGAPSGKQTTIRMSSDVFPHTTLDQADTQSLRGSTRFKSGFKTALSAVFGKRNPNDLEVNTASSTSRPRSASVASESHFYFPHPLDNPKKSLKSNELLSESHAPAQETPALEVGSLGSHARPSRMSSCSPGISNISESPTIPSMASASASGDNLSSSFSSTMHRPDADHLSHSPSFLPLAEENTEAVGASTEISPTSADDDSQKERLSPSASQDGMWRAADIADGVPSMVLVYSGYVAPVQPGGRRRSYSQPMMRRDVVATLRRKNNIQDRMRNTLTSAAEMARMMFVKMHYMDDSAAILKVPGDMTLEQLLAKLCKRRGYDFESHSFEFADKTVPAEMDRRLDFYGKENNQLELFIVKKPKIYSTICVSEDGNDVMVMQVIAGKTQITGASLEKILDLLMDTRSQDETFLDMILLTFRSFMKPEEFLNQLVARFYCELPPEPTPEDLEYYKNMKVPTQRRVFFVLQWWIEHHWHDFGLSTQFRQMLEAFLQEIVSYPDYDFGREGRELMRVAEKQKQWFEDLLATYTIGERRTKTIESMFYDLEPGEVAQQLCIHNYGIFKNIHPIEFLNEIWNKDNDSSPSFKFFVERFDKESYWVATELVRIKDIKKRTVVLKKFIQLVKESLDLNNFFTTFAIVAGLNLTPVQRLKKTWEALPEKSKKLWSEVEKIADPSKNMKNYRDRLAISTTPMVPFLPIYLKDLTFINDGNPAKVRGMINVEKLRMMSSRVLEITSLAKADYPYSPQPAVLNYLAKPPVEKNLAKLKELAAEVEKDK
ncbi:hypothetical protein HK105_203702 [Polyrhizophydium stewartii]|uniref:Ras guanine nucleotide exchange factor n=1 Tax=Polyrhizophydium stewartii TaxID=2732419 RepID=A0ABR4NAQ4_9FUNG